MKIRCGLLSIDKDLARYHEASEDKKKSAGDQLLLACAAYLQAKPQSSQARDVEALKKAVEEDLERCADSATN